MGKSTELNKPLYMAFRDYEKSFDSVDTTAVMKAIERLKETYIGFLESIYYGCTGTIILHKKSGRLPVKKGV